MAMTTPAKRVVYLTMIQLPYDEETNSLVFDESATYLIKASDYAKVCDISPSQAYRQLKEGINELKKTTVEIPKSQLGDDLDFADEPDDFVVMFSIADYCGYSDGEGFVKLRFHRKMKPLISALERKFTTQYLLSAVRLPIGNANNFYLLLREMIGNGKRFWFDIEFEELKEKLMIDSVPRYESYQYFNSDFFKRSSKQILEKTEFTHLSIDIIERVKRKAHKVRISYAYKDEKKLYSAKYEARKTKAHMQKEEDIKQDNVRRRFGLEWLNEAEAELRKFNWDDGIIAGSLPPK